MLTVLGVLAALAFGFVFGRVWQIRRDELERDFALPTTAQIPERKGRRTLAVARRPAAGNCGYWCASTTALPCEAD